MPPAPAVQRKAVGRAAVISIPVLAILTVLAVAALAVLRSRLRLAAGDEGRQPFDVFVIGRLKALVPGLVVLLRWLRLRLLVLLRLLVVLRLLMVRLLVLLRLLLLARIVGLLLRCERLAAHGRLVIVAVVERIVGVVAALLRLLLIEGRLGMP